MTAAHDGTYLAPQVLSHRIRDAIVRQIVSGELEPGERLIETALAAAFGTSQAPVREALRQLDTFGLVEIKPRRGTFVRAFVQQTMRESYVVRAALEEAATRLVMMAGSAPVELLETEVRSMAESADRDDMDGIVTGTVRFHRHILEAADNDLLLHSWEALQIEARTSVILMAASPDLHAIMEDHGALATSLTGGDVEAACRDARIHQWNYADLTSSVHT